MFRGNAVCGVTAALTAALVLIFFSGERIPRVKGQSPWQDFQGFLAETGMTVLAKHGDLESQALAIKLYDVLLEEQDPVTRTPGHKFGVSYEILVWPTNVPAEYAPFTGPGKIRSSGNGLVSSSTCHGWQESDRLPPPIQIGKFGWPCFRGGAMEVLPLRSQRLCMIFYLPMNPPDLESFNNKPALTRVQRYAAVAKQCVTEEVVKRPISLSATAKCIMENYLIDKTKVKPRRINMAALRGVAVFFEYRFDQKHGLAMGFGEIALECMDVQITGTLLPPIKLCHAALFSCIEKSRP